MFAIQHANRRAHLLGVTEHPDNGFVTQAARELVGDLTETGRSMKFLISDRDTKFTASFDEVFTSESRAKRDRTQDHSDRGLFRQSGFRWGGHTQ